MKIRKIEKIHKDEITSIQTIYDTENDHQKLVTTSMDGFIKMIDLEEETIKKAFFVC